MLLAALLAGVLVWWSPRYWPVATGIIALSVAAAVWAVTASEVVFRPIMIPVGLMGIWGFLQLLAKQTVIPSFTLRVSITWLMCALAFFLSFQILRRPTNRHVFLTGLLWSVTALAVEALLQIYSVPVRVFGLIPAADSVIGTIIYANQFAALMELAAPIALWQIQQGRVVAGGLAFSAMFAATVAGASRAGFALLLAELIVFLIVMFFSGEWRLKRGAAVVLTVVLLVGWASAVAGTDKLWGKLQEKNPYEFRHQLLLSTESMIRDAPWFGHGIGTWRAVYPRYATLDMSLIANEAHNDWAQWASDGGIPFALLILVVGAALSRVSVRSVWGIGIISVLAHCYIDYPMRAQPIAFIWFSLAGALAAIRETNTSETSQDGG